ncbi:hypothetical protein ACJRO7_017112 [Eucalyptus globulus]|uniref:DUF4220 domain-containing protein n=1 Tax=Eucalyptus globulus TaxID=34317 RepID=A0ABD3KR76_EUCGL
MSMFSDLEWLSRDAYEKCPLRDEYEKTCYLRGKTAAKLEIQVPLLVKIEALLAITAAIIVFIGIFGSFRRCCSNSALASVAFAAYTLSPAIIAYTLGLIQSYPLYSYHFLIWAAYLVVVLGSADSYTAHSIEDIEQWKSISVNSAAKCLMTSWMIASFVTEPVSALLCTLLLFVILFMKIDERARALMLASNSVMQKNYKLLADYMSTEHIDSSDKDPTTMSGYKYLVRVPEEANHSLCSTATWRRKATLWLHGNPPNYRQQLKMTGEIITIEKVWNCTGSLLSADGGDPDGRLKDLCLSFSLFKFICLRFSGYSLPQEAHNKLWHLIEHMISKEDGDERVFRVIETELAFLFNLFFTKYPVNLNPRRSAYRLLLLAIVVAAALILPPLVSKHPLGRFLHRYDWNSFSTYFIVTISLMISILIVEFAQFGIMIFSEWAKVTYICKYVQNERWQSNKFAGKLIGKMCRVWLLKPWGRQLRQYSLLESYSYSPGKCLYNRLATVYFNPTRNGQKQIAPTKLSQQVTKAITRSLRANYPDKLEKGKASLRLNHLLDELSWACNLETTAQVIMVWHIATTFCEHEAPLKEPQILQEQRDNFCIATTLSQYLAYLVAFAPTLLPDHPCRTEYIFGRAVSEATHLFGESTISQKLKEVIHRGPQLGRHLASGVADEDGIWKETTVARGAQLGRCLVDKVATEAQIWKVLADYWAEMMLYVAPSNDPAAHVKYLTMGGEFVTHVWVLVSHVGITRDLHDGERHDDPERD